MSRETLQAHEVVKRNPCLTGQVSTAAAGHGGALSSKRGGWLDDGDEVDGWMTETRSDEKRASVVRASQANKPPLKYRDG